MPRGPAWLWWGPAGILLAGLHVLLALSSARFDYEAPNIGMPVTALVGVMALSGLVYLLALRGLASNQPGKGALVWIVALGVLHRVAMFNSTPVLEDDFYRYLWDGGVAARGFNPYVYSPEQVLSGETGVPAELIRLAEESEPVARRINHPDLSTIYPPVAQAAFVLAHWLGPWSLNAWRMILFGFDAATMGLLGLILRRLKLPLHGLLIYWWNPLLIKEIYNSGHMDMVIFPFLLGAMLLSMKKKYIWAAFTLALAVGVKVWPVILLPILLRPVLSNAKRIVPALAVFLAATALMFLPICLGRLDSGSGFTAYSQRWEMNDALFMLILWGVEFVTGLFHLSDFAPQVTRIAVAGILSVWILWLGLRPAQSPAALADKCLFAVAALFLLSPTQFPWYSLWMLPFLAVRPRFSLLGFTALLPLYYLFFYFSARGQAGVFHHGVVWMEFVPVWLVIVVEFLYHRRTDEKPT